MKQKSKMMKPKKYRFALSCHIVSRDVDWLWKKEPLKCFELFNYELWMKASALSKIR